MLTRSDYYRVFSSLLSRLGINADRQGYHYIVYICTEIMTYSSDLTETSIKLPISNLYKQAATRYNTNSHNVEGCVKTAIDKVFLQGNCELLEEIFGYNASPKTGVAKNKVFVYGLCNYVNAYSEKINL